MLYQRRVRYFTAPIEFCFALSGPSLIIIGIVTYLYRDAAKIFSTSSIVLIVILSAGILIVQLPQLKKHLNSIILSCKRVLYIELLNAYEYAQKDFLKYCIRKIIRIPFLYKRIDYSLQKKILDEIHSSLRQSERSVFFVEGVSGSGKSTMTPFLLRKIISDTGTSPFSEKIYFFDFARSALEQQQFLQSYARTAMQNSVIIIDNFHRVREDLLRKVTQNIIDCNAGCLEKCIILLSQPLHKFAGGAASDLRLISEIQRIGTFRQISIETVPDRAFEDRISEQVKALTPLRVNTEEKRNLFRIHYNRLLSYSQISGGDKTHSALIELETKLNQTLNLKAAESQLIELLALIVGLSIHREGFSISEFKSACYQIKKGGFLRKRLYCLRLSRKLKLLARSGFIVEGLHQKRVFAFHQTLAIFYKEKLGSLRSFEEPLYEIMQSLSKEARKNAEHTMVWLYALESHNIGEMAETFHDALMEGQIKLMHEHLFERGTRLQASGFQYFYQMGILHERVGQFHLARQDLKKALRAPQSEISADYISIFLIEAEHGANSLTQLNSIRERTVPTSLLNSLAHYWEIHIGSHFGVFQLSELESIAEKVRPHVDSFLKENAYFAVHFFRRLYFDMVRFYYLLGIRDGKKFAQLKSHFLFEVLERNHVEFDAYFCKFVEAHYLHYDLLFEVGVFQKTALTHDLLNENPGGLDLEELIISKALKKYQKAIMEFSIFGDKTVDYLYARVLELEMAYKAVNTERVRQLLNNYSEFIQNSGFSDMRGYVELYRYKYDYLQSIEVLNNGNVADHELFHGRALKSVQSALRIHIQTGNTYGEVRSQFFLLLSLYQKNKDWSHFQTELDTLRAKCKKNGYLRELSIIEHIFDNGGLSMNDIIRIVRYYPIVHQ